MRKLDDFSSPEGKTAANEEIGRKRSLGSPADGTAGDLSAVYVTFAGTGAEIAVSHTLGRVPVGWTLVHKSATGDVWAGTRTWTDQQLFLVGTNAVTFKALVF